MTAKKYMALVRGLSCCICAERPVHFHHPRKYRLGAGAGKKSHWIFGIPLCVMHHTSGGYKVAVHHGQESWERKFGGEEPDRLEELLSVRVRGTVAELAGINAAILHRIAEDHIAKATGRR